MRRLARLARLRRSARRDAAAHGLPPAAAFALVALGTGGVGYLDRSPLTG